MEALNKRNSPIDSVGPELCGDTVVVGVCSEVVVWPKVSGGFTGFLFNAGDGKWSCGSISLLRMVVARCEEFVNDIATSSAVGLCRVTF